MTDLMELRASLDTIDKHIVQLYEERMHVVRQIAEYKLKNHMDVLDSSREQQVLASRQAMLSDNRYDADIQELYTLLMRLSRADQERLLAEASND